MKILQVNTATGRGSIGHIEEQIGNLVLQSGGDSTIAYSWGILQSNSNLLPIGSPSDRYLHALGARLFDNAGLLSAHATKQFLQQVEIINPDIIHLHNIHGYYLNYEILFSWLRKSRIPVVWTLHDCWPFTGHCAHFTYAKCDKWRSGCDNCKQLRAYPKSWLWDGSKRNYRRKKNAFSDIENLTLVTVSKWLENVVRQSFLKDYPIRQIYNGIDTETFSPQSAESDKAVRSRLGINNRYMLLVVCADWARHKEKGIDDIIKLSYLLPKKYAIVLVGMTKEQLRSIPSHIITVERIESQKELATFYSAADVVLNLSYEESMGMTTVEGLSCGTPSIVYNSTASPELVDTSTGFVFEPGDIEHISRQLPDICAKAGSMHTQCRERVLQHFNMTTQFQKYLELYHHLLSSK